MTRPTRPLRRIVPAAGAIAACLVASHPAQASRPPTPDEQAAILASTGGNAVCDLVTVSSRDGRYAIRTPTSVADCDSERPTLIVARLRGRWQTLATASLDAPRVRCNVALLPPRVGRELRVCNGRRALTFAAFDPPDKEYKPRALVVDPRTAFRRLRWSWSTTVARGRGQIVVLRGRRQIVSPVTIRLSRPRVCREDGLREFTRVAITTPRSGRGRRTTVRSTLPHCQVFRPRAPDASTP